MDMLIQFKQILICYLLPVAISTIYCLLKNRSYEKRCTPPQAGGAWPVLGHLHLLRGAKQLPHMVLGAMADKYGPIFTVKLGSQEALVLNSCEVAKECFTVHDHAFSNRPITSAAEILGQAMISFSPYGPYWREMRKIAVTEQLSNHRLHMLKDIRGTEVKNAIKELHRMCVESGKGRFLVDLKQWFGDMGFNISVIMVGGKRCLESIVSSGKEESKRLQILFGDTLHFFGVFDLGDAVPLLGWLDVTGYRKAMKKIAVELDNLMENWLEEHKMKKMVDSHGDEDRDFMNALLTKLKDSNNADLVTKANCLNLLLAAGDVIKVTLTWTLTVLLNNPESLKKVQTEIDNVIGRDRLVEESDIKNLPYLQAVVKEVLRICPPEPLNGIRATTQDCTLSSGYFIPAGTRVMVNIYKIQHDERVWPNANEFIPERFLTTHKDIDVRGVNFELIPFGAGRRMCPGASLAMQVVHLAVASLLQSFEVSRVSDELVDMTGTAGLSSMKVGSLDALLAPRLGSELYK